MASTTARGYTAAGASPSLSPSEAKLLSPYHYVPTSAVCVIFLVLFIFSFVCHVAAAVRFRLWWIFPTIALAGFGEILGWAARLWSSNDVTNPNPFLMQISCTIIAPTPLLAAIFIMFAEVSKRLGPEYGRLSPRWYSRIFLTCDIIALVIQAVGGGLASSAKTVPAQNLGSNIMLAGIIFQLIVLIGFSSLAVDFFYRFLTVGRHDARKMEVLAWNLGIKLMSATLAFCTVVLFIRSIYRVAELADGWNGRIISTQVYFNVLDGMMVILAMWALNFFHPGWLLFTDETSQATGAILRTRVEYKEFQSVNTSSTSLTRDAKEGRVLQV